MTTFNTPHKKWQICDCCRGEGRVDHPAFANGITSSEWQEMAHDWDNEGEMNAQQRYMRGDYDVPCVECGGRGSVKVPDRFIIERYSHVMHIVSNVEGKLKEGLNALAVLRATFPAGTVSGAPKVRAMEIIDELEPVKRGIYAGAVGYLGFHGDMDLAIAIRTAVIKDGQIHVQAGAGIVADSDPDSEWQETQSKARAMLRAAEMAEGGLDTVGQ